MIQIVKGKKTIINVVIRIKTSDYNDKKKKKEINSKELEIVLDRSGSIYGAPINNCIKAIKNIIDSIKVNDIIHLVFYNNYAQVVIKKWKF